MNTTISAIAFDPLLPWGVLLAFAIVAIGLAFLGATKRARGLILRLAAIFTILGALANPSLVEEERKPVDDIALVITDDSDSQGIGERRQQAAAARAAMVRKIAGLGGVEVREAVLPPSSLQLGSQGIGGTRLIGTLRNALADIPRERLSAVVLITDGQVHDVPQQLAADLTGAPVHVLLTGKKDEADRLLVVEQAPRFGVVGRNVTMKLRVVDTAPDARGPVPLIVKVGNDAPMRLNAPLGRAFEVEIPVSNPGANVIQVEVPPGTRELTLDNNRALFVVNGVRDRLRVLLVSGEPYQGERAWRNLLKGDPAVDVIHFTILRTPSKDDFTPTRELSLIQFPMKELFDLKLREFDLIIFDRYETGNLITREYFRNIAQYVQNGGALLVSVGPVYATPRTLHRTPLGAVLPAAPLGEVIERAFKPTVTTLGDRHPVTADLTGAGKPAPMGVANAQREEPSWGRWFRQIATRADRGHTLMAGADNRPLIVLDRAGEGRVAQILSDHLWLWNRGVDGGGPQAELVRRMAHWLMKEPDLEEEALRATVQGARIELRRQTMAEGFRPVTMTGPDGRTQTLTLNPVAPGRAIAGIGVDKPGVYRFDDGEKSAVAAVGNPDPLEFADVRASPDKLQPLVEASGGAMIWLGEAADPDVRAVQPGRTMGGSDWLGIRRNGGYTVTGVDRYPLLPGIAIALLFLFAIGFAWWREGK
ncbi:MAG: hypothetical protein FJX20_20635 [Alphaproteobacteria bacterium]|nr:hypothetical protein [Alphaproteobacteria bacterium]